jgi:hypothetical protein
MTTTNTTLPGALDLAQRIHGSTIEENPLKPGKNITPEILAEFISDFARAHAEELEKAVQEAADEFAALRLAFNRGDARYNASIKLSNRMREALAGKKAS